MNRDIEIIAAKGVIDAYKAPCFRVGSTEWNESTFIYNDIVHDAIYIPGSNDFWDWIWNFRLSHKHGVKKAVYVSTNRILERYKRNIKRPLLIAGHSKEGPTALHMGAILNAKYAIAFCPARGFKSKIKLENSKIFIDYDDIVPKLAFNIFEHPECEFEYLPDDPGINWGHHSMDHVLNHLESTKR